MSDVADRASELAAPHWNGWSSLWRGGLLALGITFALSTQLLFQFDLYEDWGLPDTMMGWLDHFLDQLRGGS